MRNALSTGVVWCDKHRKFSVGGGRSRRHCSPSAPATCYLRGVLFTRQLALWFALGTHLGCSAHSASTPENLAIVDYSPTEIVRGRSAPAFPALDSAHPTVSAEALLAARTYAQDHGSLGFIVLHRGKLALQWYADGVDAETPIESEAMARTLAGLLLGTVIADGRIFDVDRPITEVYPEWLQSPKREALTWRHLLEMSTGLRDAPTGLQRGHSVEAAVLAVPGERLPGFAFAENPVATQLISLGIERATGRRYADYLSERLWRPIGAADAQVWLDHREGTARSFCCMAATTLDWARVGELIRLGGAVSGVQVIPHDWVVRMTLPSKTNPDYGWQIWRGDDGPGSTRRKERAEDFLDRSIVWMEGAGDQRVYVMPKSGFVVVRLGKDSLDWDDSVIPNFLVRGMVEP